MKTTNTKWFASVSLTKLSLVATGVFLAATSGALATVRYVNANNATPTPPYTNWVTAAGTIQQAVNASVAGDEIVVTNGTYAPVTVTTQLTVQSVNGPNVTEINGRGGGPCVYLTNNAVMVGFTLTNGSAIAYNSSGSFGGGVYCESTSAVLSNCVLTLNFAFDGGGGAYGGTLNNCTLTGNSAYISGGGGTYNCTLNNCTLTGNSADDGEGGGAADSTLNNCTLTGNSAKFGGGGAFGGTLNNCVLTGNSTGEYGAAGYGGGAEASTLNNCTLTGNSAGYGGGYGGGAYGGTLNNSTLAGNSAYEGGGAYDCTLTNCTVTGNSAGYGGAGGGAYESALNNCIVYFNSAPLGGNYDSSCTLNYCCTTPLPTTGVGNISVDPQLASATYLSAESPCIGAGSATYTSGTDINGDAWANPPSIGCDEYHAGAVTGPMTVSLRATFTNVATGFPVGLTAFIAGRTDLSVWDFGDGFVQVNEPYTSHAWTAPGDYLVALWAFNDSYPGGVSATATVHVVEGLYYVAVTSGNPVAPYTSWATAATNIQAAVDVAPPGGTIFVTNGTYAPVTVKTPLTVQSVNGPNVNVINGGGVATCVSLTNDAVMVGFTLTNGYGYDGGGVYCQDTSAVLSNCVLTGNSAEDGGGAYGGTLNNCVLTGNLAQFAGGGAYNCTLNNCTVTGNSADYYGGGACNGSLNNCTLTDNSVGDAGGGAYDCTLGNCTVTGNSAAYGGGAYGGTLNNCTLTGDSASVYGGGAYFYCTLNNCTVTGNSASDDGGGADYHCTLNNCIVYFNTATNGTNYDSSCTLNYCCTMPLPGSSTGNITNAPDLAPLGNYGGPTQTMPPLPGSPAIGAGSVADNTFSTDQRGYPRTQNGLIDIGAVELQSPAANPPVLENIAVPAGGGNGLQFTFTNAPAADFTVLTATNVSLPLTNWTVLGEVQQVAPGQYLFTDPQAATNRVRFYRVRSP